MNSLQGLRVAILATNGFEEAELVEPRKVLDEAGAKTTVLSPESGKIQGMRHSEKGSQIPVDAKLSEASPDQFDALLLPGGVANADKLRMDKHALEFARSFDNSQRPIAVICHGPWLLVSAGLAKGRHLTSYYTLQDDLRNAGARWTDEEVVRDKNWVSSRQPHDLPAFNDAMLQLFAEARQSHQAEKSSSSQRTQKKGASSGT